MSNKPAQCGIASINLRRHRWGYLSSSSFASPNRDQAKFAMIPPIMDKENAQPNGQSSALKTQNQKRAQKKEIKVFTISFNRLSLERHLNPDGSKIIPSHRIFLGDRKIDYKIYYFLKFVKLFSKKILADKFDF